MKEIRNEAFIISKYQTCLKAINITQEVRNGKKFFLQSSKSISQQTYLKDISQMEYYLMLH